MIEPWNNCCFRWADLTSYVQAYVFLFWIVIFWIVSSVWSSPTLSISMFSSHFGFRSKVERFGVICGADFICDKVYTRSFDQFSFGSSEKMRYFCSISLFCFVFSLLIIWYNLLFCWIFVDDLSCVLRI